MLKNYLLTAIRNFRRKSGFSSINILGLSIGIACCFILLLIVRFELSYDRYHEDVDRIYRIEKISNIYGKTEKYAAIPRCVGDAIAGLEEVEAMGRFGSWRSSTVRYKEQSFKEDNIRPVEPGLFNVLTIPVVEGDPASLEKPFTALLTERMAHKYFKDENPLGKFIEIDTNRFEVTGVIRDIPPNTHMKFEIMISEITTDIVYDMPEEIRAFNHLPTYIKLASWSDPAVFEKKIENLGNELNMNLQDTRGEIMTLFLIPLTDIHLYSNLRWEVEPPGNPTMVYAFIGICILILFTTCFNFMNLSTARFINRAKEVGVRKTFGGTRTNLIRQFLGETLLMAFFAHIIAMFLVEIFLPVIVRLSGIPVTIHYLDPVTLLFILFIIITLGLLAGSYPAFFLSSFNPVDVFKGGWNPSKKGLLFRKILVTGQFTVSVGLVIIALVIQKQMIYMKNKPLGFIKEQKLVLQLPEGKVLYDNYKRVKNEFLEHPGIAAATISSSVPGRWRYFWRLWPTGEKESNTKMVNCLQADFDFISIYGLQVIAGEPFHEELSPESNRGFLVNEATLSVFGWNSHEEALQKTINQNANPVRGILKNYHFKGLQSEIEPLGLFLIEDDFRYLTLVFEEHRVNDVLDFTRKKHKELFPDSVIDYFFLDEDFEAQYLKEEKQSVLVTLFTMLAIFIACLGLFGMASYTLENRRKEIGIRKTNGATAVSLFFLMTWDFTLLILVAFIIASPLAWWGCRVWLNDFAYRTSLNWWIFLLAVGIVLVISYLTIGYQALKAARTNPVDSLRYE